MNRTDPFVRSTGTMLMQCRFVYVLLTLFLFSTFTADASLSLLSDSIEKRVAAGFSAAIFLKPGIYPEKGAIEKAGAIPGVGKIVLIEPSAAPGVIARQVNRSAAILTQGVSVNCFPFTIVLTLERQQLSKAEEIISLVANEIKGVQEVRYPVEGLKAAQDTLNRLEDAQKQFGAMMLFVLVAGCLSIVKLAVRPRPAFCWQYSVTGLLSGVSAALLMVMSVNLASSTTGWQFLLDEQYYLWIVAAGLASGGVIDITVRFRKAHHTKIRSEEVETPHIPEPLP